MLWILLVGIDALEGFVDGGPWGIAGIRWKWNRLSGTFVEDPSDGCGGKGEEGKEEEEAFHFCFPFFVLVMCSSYTTLRGLERLSRVRV
jgi:hypothetical protein